MSSRSAPWANSTRSTVGRVSAPNASFPAPFVDFTQIAKVSVK